MTSYGSEVTEVGPADCRSQKTPHPKGGWGDVGSTPQRGQWLSHAARRARGGRACSGGFLETSLLHSLRHDIFLSVLCGEILDDSSVIGLASNSSTFRIKTSGLKKNQMEYKE